MDTSEQPTVWPPVPTVAPPEENSPLPKVSFKLPRPLGIFLYWSAYCFAACGLYYTENTYRGKPYDFRYMCAYALGFVGATVVVRFMMHTAKRILTKSPK